MIALSCFPFFVRDRGRKLFVIRVAEMDFDGGRYYTINRVMLSTVGLWPYQSVWFTRIQRVFCLVCLVTGVTLQLLTFVTFEYNLGLLLDILSYVIPFLIVVLKYVTYCAKTESMRKLIETIKHDWNTLRNEIEYKIIHKYTHIGAFYAQMFALVTYAFPLLFASIHLIPNLLDLVAPLNQSRPHQLIILVEYFVDIDEYFSVILLHLTVTIFVVQNTLMSTTSMYVAYIQHACGMLEIASYRIEHALVEDEKDNPTSERRCTACARIIGAVDIHRRAIEFFEFMKDTFVIMYFFLLLLGVASLTVNLYRAVITEGVFERLLSVLNVCVHLFYFFLVNYAGQMILDHCNDFFTRIYNSKWYDMSLHAQKLILFIMQRGSKNCILLVGGLYIASLEGFAVTMSTSVSYFMVIYSTQ
ncbi:odorant receptor 49a-like isoform X2 [Harpegnathos saltator]|uniref:odorant receptor 49a-like isoform X2 n=1 Tax=Harpegnathos saltator TaxID=610380 RepID=UPI000948FC63|nr:odorant receptor 49a-like isoform X2 [Harpegnathos saltator]